MVAEKVDKPLWLAGVLLSAATQSSWVCKLLKIKQKVKFKENKGFHDHVTFFYQI